LRRDLRKEFFSGDLENLKTIIPSFKMETKKLFST
jgi:hypothetical protein